MRRRSGAMDPDGNPDNFGEDDTAGMLEPDHPAMERVQFALQKQLKGAAQAADPGAKLTLTAFLVKGIPPLPATSGFALNHAEKSGSNKELRIFGV